MTPEDLEQLAREAFPDDEEFIIITNGPGKTIGMITGDQSYATTFDFLGAFIGFMLKRDPMPNAIAALGEIISTVARAMHTEIEGDIAKILEEAGIEVPATEEQFDA